MELRKLDEGLWAAEGELSLPGMRLPTRTTVVQLQEEGLLVLSPHPELPRLRAQLDALGPVRALVAPNLFHHLGLPAASRTWPGARVFGPPGLQRKRPDVHFSGTLDGAPDALWAPVLEQVHVGGMPKVEEVAFFHRPSRTLLLSDLCFHLTHSAHWPTRLFMRLNGAYGRFGPSRFARSLMREPAAVRHAVDRMLAWNPERIVVAHGEVVERDGRRVLEEAFASMR